MRGRGASHLLASLLGAALTAAGCLQTVVLQHDQNSGAGGGTVGGNNDASNYPMDVGGWNPETSCPGTPSVKLDFTQNLPDVIVAFDRSMPPNAHFGDGPGTWLGNEQAALQQAMMGSENAIDFGYQEFPVNTPGCSGSPGCCAGEVTAPAPAPAALQNIQQVMNACATAPGGCLVSTAAPTVGALDQVLQFYSMFNDQTPYRYLLLATNGDPNCTSDGTDPCTDATMAIALLLRNWNVTTIVVGVGDGTSNSSCLDKMAKAGGFQRMNGPPAAYMARDPNALSSMLTDILGNVAGSACKIALSSPTSDPADVALYLNGIPILRDPSDKNGWNFDAGSQLDITFYGTSCTMVQNSNLGQSLTILGCPNGQR